MNWNDLILRLKALVFHGRTERELGEELDAHIDMAIEQGLRRGLSREEARREALILFGGSARVAEECRDQRGTGWLEDFARDLQYAFRQFLKQKSFYAIAAVTLALGIGANTAIFSAVNGVLLRPLPYQDPSRLVSIWCSEPSRGVPQMGFALPDLHAVAGRNHSFASVSGYYFGDINIIDGTPEKVLGMYASANLFPLLGVRPVLGRTFSPSEELYGSHRVVVLSHALWTRRLGARLSAIGETVRLNGDVVTIVGVMPPDFRFADNDVQLWMPMSFAPNDEMATRDNHFISAIARLKPGTGIVQTRADIQSFARQLQREFSENAGLEMDASDYLTSVVGDVREVLLILLGAVGMVLLIACVNVANLLLFRAAARLRELSIRTALGAGRARLVRQLLTEAVLLGSMAACLGIALGAWLVELIRKFGPDEIPRLRNIQIDVHVLLFSAGVTVCSVLLFGVAPVLDLARVQVSDALKEGGRSLTTGGRTNRFRDILVIAEITLSLVLVIGAGLLVRSLQQLQHVDPGFRLDHLLTMSVSLPQSKYPDSEPLKIARFYDQLMRSIEQIPGVKAAAASTALPIANWGGWGKYFTVEDHPASRQADVPLIQYREVTTDYLRALGIPLIQGRFFTEDDTGEGPLVAVINESARRRFFPNENPIGKLVHPGPPESTIPKNLLPSPDFRSPRLTIIGVIGDVRHAGLSTPPEPELFVAHLQGTVKYNESSSTHMYLMVKTNSDPLHFVRAVSSVVQSLDPEQPVGDIATMDQRLDSSLYGERFRSFLFGAFAVLALVLAAVGIYGVISYSVRVRTPEIGIRMALGAGTPEILNTILKHALKLSLIGILSGVVLALGVTRLMSTLLFGIKANDSVTFLGASLISILVIAAASVAPALRATRTDPLRVLRAE